MEGTGIRCVDIAFDEGGEYLRCVSGGALNVVPGVRGDLGGGGGGVFGKSRDLGRSSGFGRTGRGDKGGLLPEFATTLTDRGGSEGRVGVGGSTAFSTPPAANGDSTIITG